MGSCVDSPSNCYGMTLKTVIRERIFVFIGHNNQQKEFIELQSKFLAVAKISLTQQRPRV